MHENFNSHARTIGDVWISGTQPTAAPLEALQLPDLYRDTPGLTRLPTIPLPLSPVVVALEEDGSLAAEKFRMLAARLRFLQTRRQLKKLLITSLIKGEGKTMVSANLALTLARRQKTLLIDGDLRLSGLEEVLGSQGMAGITDWWHGSDDISNFLRRVDGLPLWYLPAGQIAEHALELLQSQKMAGMLTQMAECFDWIIIDSPPLVPLADPHVWASYTDGALLIVRQGKTPKKLLKKTLENSENLNLIGVVVNDSTETQYRYYRQYYGKPRNSNPQVTSGTPPKPTQTASPLPFSDLKL
jgi:protein-tyrosine kinase